MSAIEEKYKDFTREELLSWIEHCEIFFDENLVQDNEFNARFSVYGRLVRYATKKNDELAALRGRVKVLEEAIKPFAEIPCLENFDDNQLFDPAGGVLAGDVRKARIILNREEQ